MRRGVVGIKRLDTLNFWVYTKLWLKNRYFFRSAGACPPRSLHGEGQAPRPTGQPALPPHRSAGACPPRSLDCARHGEGNPLGCACGIRGPSYDERRLSAAAAPVVAPPYCIETRRSLLRGTQVCRILDGKNALPLTSAERPREQQKKIKEDKPCQRLH